MGIPAIPNRRDPQFGDEKMNNHGKFASVLAVFAVVACLLMAVPSVEATGDGTSAPEEIGADGFLALAQDGVLTLQKDYVLTSALAVEDELTIDLNGHSIVNSDANANHTIDVSETGKLTIEDSIGTGTVDNVTHAKAAIMNNGEVVLEGGKFTRSIESASNTYYVIDNHGTLTIHDGVTVSKTSEEQHSSMIRNADGATLTIQGGTFESGKDIAVKNDTSGVLRIYDGTFTPAKISTDFAVQNWGTATIMGGTFKGIVASMSDDENASSMTVENGTFSGKVLAWNFVDNYVSGMDPADKAASVVINGGNFSTPASNYAAIIGGTGSTFMVTDPTIASYVINGGTFGSNVFQYLADDVVLVNRDGKYVVTQDTAGSVAKVGQVYFTDLATAFKNCADSTVVLTDDITLGASVTITKNNVVVDLNGHVISGELSGRFVYTHDKTVTFRDSVGGGAIINLGGDAISGKDGDTSVTIENGVYMGDMSAFVAEGKAIYDYDGISIIGDEVTDPVLTLGEVPFGSLSDMAEIVNLMGETIQVSENTMTLLADLQTGGMAVTVEAGSDITIDLNGNDAVFTQLDVEGRITFTDDSEAAGKVYAQLINVNGGSISGNVMLTAQSSSDMIYINGSGSITGVGIDMTAATGGAITVNPGVTGKVSVTYIVVFVDGTESTVDRGIFVNQTAKGGSVVIDDVRFTFNGNDACPVVIVPDENSTITISDLTYVDCARTNKVLIDAQTTPVTIGSKGNVDFSGISDIVLWDPSEDGDNVFTVAGDIVVDGRISVTSGGQLVIPKDASMVVNDVIEITSDASVAGKLVFGSDRTNSIELSDVLAGDDGLTLSLGSVVISGSVASGALTLSGDAVIDGNVDLGEAVLKVPKGSTLTVPSDSSVTGTADIEVSGEMVVFGSVASPVQNDGRIDVYEGGEVSGDVTGNQPVNVDEVVVTICDISDFSIELDQLLRVAISVLPADARITADIDGEPLDVNGRTISWQPTETGTFTVTVTAEYDGQVDTETFKVTVTDPSTPEDEPFDWKLIVVMVLIVIVILAVLRMVL